MDKVTPGQKLNTSPLRKANNVNAIADAVNAFTSGQLQKPTSGTGLGTPTDLVKVRNLTGAARARGEVVQLGEYLLDAVDFRNLWFKGNTVAAPVERRYAILREPAPAGEIKVAQVSGVCIAKVNVTDLEHTHAIPEAASHVLKSAAAGPVELLMEPTGTGEQDVAVRLGPSIGQAQLIEYTTTTIFTAGSATATVTDFYQGTYPGAAVTVRDTQGKLTDAAVGFKGVAAWDNLSEEYHNISSETEPGSVVQFELTGDLLPGLTANAERVTWNGSAWVKDGVTIVVEDFGDGFGWWKGTAGLRGAALQRNDTSNYQILWLDDVADWIDGTLGEDMGEGTADEAAVDVIRALRGNDPEALLTSGVFAVTDTNQLFRRALTGAKYIAFRDTRFGSYDLVQCQSKSGFIQFVAQAAPVTNAFEGTISVVGTAPIVVTNDGLGTYTVSLDLNITGTAPIVVTDDGAGNVDVSIDLNVTGVSPIVVADDGAGNIEVSVTTGTCETA